MARIVVIGGSLGGLLVGNMLSRAGHDVKILEKSPTSLDGRGAGIVTHPLLVQAMQRCGVQVDVSLGVSVNQRVVLGTDGAVLEQVHIPQVLSSWSRLYALLLAQCEPARYLGGACVARIEQGPGSATVHCEDGRRFEADLVIASDGIRSVARAQYLPAAQAQYAGYVAWRGVCDEAVLSQYTLNSLFENFSFSVPPGELIIGYPVAGAGNAIAKGQRRYNFVWYRPTDSDSDGDRDGSAQHRGDGSGDAALQALLTDADGHCYAHNIPPNKVAWRQVAAMRQAARQLLAPQFAEVLEKTPQPFLQPIHDCASSAIAFGRVALMGDAAFVARPHVGMGVTKAAEDATALTDLISQHGATAQALQAFERARLAPAQAVIARARALGGYMRAHSQADARRAARTMMLETAIDLSQTPIEKLAELEHA